MNEMISRAFLGVMPSIEMVPPVGSDKPEMSFKIVDLRQPDGPIILANSPFEIVRFTGSTTVGPAPKRLVRPDNSIIGTVRSGIMPSPRQPANTARQDIGCCGR